MQKLLTPAQLSERWNIHVGTLRNWRYKNKGLPFVKMGDGKAARVLYREQDVILFENKNFKEIDNGNANKSNSL
jgi:hypothetical protein